MPFDTLTQTQQTFISTHLLKKGVLKKTKDKYADFNRQLQASLTARFDTINALGDRIDDIAARYDHAPVGFFHASLDQQRGALRAAVPDIKTSKKTYEQPDFSAVDAALDELSTLLDDRIRDIETGKSADSPTFEKDTKSSAILRQMDLHEAAGKERIKRAKAGDNLLSLADLAERDTQIKLYESDLGRLRGELAAISGPQNHDTSEAPSAFAIRCDGILARFNNIADERVERIEEIAGREPPTETALTDALTTGPHKDLPMVKAELQRAAAASVELANVTAALDKQNQEMLALRTKFANAKGSDKDALRAEYERLSAHIAQIESRAQQFTAFAENKIAREVLILRMADTADSVATEAGEIKDMPGVVPPAWLVKDMPTPDNLRDENALEAENRSLRAVVTAAAARPLVIPRLDPAEEPMKELSDKEASGLMALLEEAKVFLDTDRLDLAQGLHSKVFNLRLAYRAARVALMLPPAGPPPVSPLEDMLVRLARLEAELNDKFASGAADAEDALNDLNRLRTRIKTDVDLIAHEADHQREIREMSGRVTGITVPRQRARPAFDEKAEQAVNVADKMEKLLAQMVKTRKLKPGETVAKPGEAYDRAALKTLVPADEVIHVPDGKGGTELHRIQMGRKGKGGEDHAKTERNTKIPPEVIQALYSQAATLRAMSEAQADGLEDMLGEYTKKADALAADIADNGHKLFPEMAKKLADADKLFTKGTLAKYKPATYGAVRQELEAMRMEYLNLAPSIASPKVTGIADKVDDLEAKAVLLETRYKDAAKTYQSLNADLLGKKNKSDQAVALKASLKDVLSQSPDDLFAAAETALGTPPDPVKEQQLAAAKVMFAKAKKDIADNPAAFDGKLPVKDLLRDLDAAYRKLETKVEENIIEAERGFVGISDKMSAFIARAKPPANTAPDDLISGLIALAETLKDGVKSNLDFETAKNDYVTLGKDVKELVAPIVKDGRKLGKSSAASTLKDEIKALEGRLSANYKKAKDDKAFASATDELHEIKRNAEALRVRLDLMANGGKAENVKHMKIAPRVDNLVSAIAALKETAKTLADDAIVPKMSDDQKTTLAGQITILKSSLIRIDSLPDGAALKTNATEIDRLNGLDTATKTERIKLRETVLKDLRALRNSIEQHPSVTLYGGNPFDLGTAFALLRQQLQQVEIAVLASVSPKEKA